MTQFRSIKSQYGDCVLLFRVGDFYETFYEDAVEVSRILNIALTSRDKNKKNPVPLAGVPYHASETYITRLLAAGKNVAVCDQVEDASQAKGLVKRAVVEVLTPGVSMNTQLLEDRENNFCLSLHIDGDTVGVALIDVSTGDFLCGEDNLQSVQHLIQGKRVREIVCSRGTDRRRIASLLESLGQPFVNEVDEELFGDHSSEEALGRQFAPNGGFSVEAFQPAERAAAGALIAHCHSLRGGSLPQVVQLERLAGRRFLALDEETIRNLELFEPLHGDDARATVIRLIDQTLTPMGGREIRTWLQKPLCDVGLIEHRADAIEELYGNLALHESIMQVQKSIRDIQRLSSRIAAGKAIPREFHALRESLEKVPQLADTVGACRSELLRRLATSLGDHDPLVSEIERAVVEDPPGHLREGGVIRQGFSSELDVLLSQNKEAKRWIASLEERERARTGIGSLKVGYNRVFGYYIEVSKLHAQSVPQDYIAKQTLVNAQRYYTEELKDREQLILECDEKRITCEQEVYQQLCARVAAALPEIQATAHAVAQIDVLQSLATTARQNRYRRPVIDNSMVLDLSSSRHPVIERLGTETFVPNDFFLDVDKKQFALLTGPNMSGKSTFLRQVALVVLLGQMGSFVPVDRARIGLVDKIFTRVGATDRLSRGESTFLVEMKETAQILEEMTDRSLVLLDEVGRGTSTYDGLSIAWAVTEYLLQGVRARPKTLFATHFHELTQLKNSYPRLVNLKITIKEWEGGIVFLRKIAPGTSDRSYGIHAAKIAGIPPLVLKRAEEILHSLELHRDLLRQGVSLERKNPSQFSLFAPGAGGRAGGAAETGERLAEVAKALRELDIDATTPLEALQLLKALQARLKR
jgi:DNA mismatch repair protein MutS